MENINTYEIVLNSLILLKSIAFSNQENLVMLSNQNILLNLFSIKEKFANYDEITNICDEISNEILKIPGQEKYADNIVEENIKEFNKEMKNDYEKEDTKKNLLNCLQNINAFTLTKKQVDMLNEKTFTENHNVLIEKTAKDNTLSSNLEKILTNEITILKKNLRKRPQRRTKQKHHRKPHKNHLQQIQLQRNFLASRETPQSLHQRRGPVQQIPENRGQRKIHRQPSRSLRELPRQPNNFERNQQPLVPHRHQKPFPLRLHRQQRRIVKRFGRIERKHQHQRRKRKHKQNEQSPNAQNFAER
jgi:hypothetical protein